MREKERFWEIDAARGAAVIMMIIFHVAFDLYFLGITGPFTRSGLWRLLAYSTASVFIFISGTCFQISYSRTRKSLSGMQLYLKYFKRGIFIFSGGVIITIATWIFVQESFIAYGILHFIGTAVILAPVFYRFGKANIALGALAILAGFCISGISGPFWLLFSGIHPLDFQSLDYVPLFPWFGVTLLGMAFGSFAYPDGKRRPGILQPEIMRKTGKMKIFTMLAFAGRNSLLIYFLHQPLILLIIKLFL